VGLVLFNHSAHVAAELKAWSKPWVGKLKSKIGSLKASGSTNLSAAAQCATDMYKSAGTDQCTKCNISKRLRN
jgi:hypothetical protein